MRKAITVFLFFLSSFCSAEYLEDLVIKRVVDGDTVHVFFKDQVYKIRLTEIDAPERDQPFGNDSTSFLKQLLLVLHKQHLKLEKRVRKSQHLQSLIV